MSTASQRYKARKAGHAVPLRRPGPARRITLDERTGCHVAQTSHPTGYAFYKVNGRRLMAHRVVWEEQLGPIPEDMVLDHLCRNRACVNPAHLELVTVAENIRRGLVAKLSAEQAEEIRASADPGVVLALRYGVSQATISLIRNGRTWREEAA